jgi:N-methylhydantoinase B/oxoprolinase/acetone carboxylase alpha subunit
VVASKLLTTLHAGDRMVVNTAGGGWGDPQQRAPTRVAADRADHKVLAPGLE